MRSLLLVLTALVVLLSSKQFQAIGATTIAPTTPSPTPAAVQTFAPTDIYVGTALAPTTPGGACLDDADYGKWTGQVGSTGKTGFDAFPIDLQTCTQYCAPLIALSQSTDYQCGGFAEAACPSDLPAICVSDCLERPTSGQGSGINFPTVMVSGYSHVCASCMGNLSYCGTIKCTGSCAQGGSSNDACVTCNILKCNPDFEVCAGLNPLLKTAPALNLTPILIGAIVGGFAALVLTVGLGAYYRSVTRKRKMLTPDEMAKMSENQNYAMNSPNIPIGSMASSRIENSPDKSSNPLYRSPSSPGSVMSVSSGLTPYQQEYMAQQDAIAKGIISPDPRSTRITPSARASQMVRAVSSQPASFMANATPLVAVYEFIAEREDELNAAVGDKMLGLEQQDGWWLAQNSKGVMGLIPVSYTAVDASTPMSSTTSKFNPNF